MNEHGRRLLIEINGQIKTSGVNSSCGMISARAERLLPHPGDPGRGGPAFDIWGIRDELKIYRSKF
jgi:hypothetical protein